MPRPALQSLTVSEYSASLLRKYLAREYAPDDPQQNLAVAAEEIYGESRRLRAARPCLCCTAWPPDTPPHTVPLPRRHPPPAMIPSCLR